MLGCVETGTDSLRERKKLRTRQALVDAAMGLISERGFQSTTIEDIAEAADVSPRTFFRYFPSKEDAVLADHDARLRTLRAALAASPPDEPPHVTLREAVMAMAGGVASGPTGVARARIILSEPSLLARSLELQAEYEDVVARELGKRMGVDPEHDARPRVMAGAAFGALRAAMRAWVASDGANDPRTIIAGAFKLLDAGLASIPSR